MKEDGREEGREPQDIDDMIFPTAAPIPSER